MPVLVLTGPTGIGKSAWAAKLAEEAPIEIVSVDSALVYRGLDIGTAKPERELRDRIPHHLIDICDPTESYSAGRFVSDAVQVITEIRKRGKAPLLVGGTLLYFRALLHGLAPLPPASSVLRRELDARAAREGWPALHAELAGLDPHAASRIKPTDPQRIQRALEVCYASGRPISQLQRETTRPLEDLPIKAWALLPAERAALHEKLEQRLHRMMRAGFLEEVRGLFQRGELSSRHSSMRAVGYRQLWAHLQGQYELEEATRRAIIATRQLAKRQLTWIRGEQGFTRVLTDGLDIQASWIRDACRQLRELGL